MVLNSELESIPKCFYQVTGFSSELKPQTYCPQSLAMCIREQGRTLSVFPLRWVVLISISQNYSRNSFWIYANIIYMSLKSKRWCQSSKHCPLEDLGVPCLAIRVFTQMGQNFTKDISFLYKYESQMYRIFVTAFCEMKFLSLLLVPSSQPSLTELSPGALKIELEIQHCSFLTLVDVP